jgi:CBS domain containing-hemolysin-like protein
MGFTILINAHSCCGKYRGCHINFFLVGFRELLPKRIGLNHPEAKALLCL